jgi:hypothetical protein
VPPQFLNHFQSENVPLARMMEDVQANQARIKVLIIMVPVHIRRSKSRPPSRAGKGSVHVENETPKPEAYQMEMNYSCPEDDNLFILIGVIAAP